MAPPQDSAEGPTGSTARPMPPKMVVVEACRADDVSQIKHAIALASLPDSRSTVNEVLSHAVDVAVSKSAENVLSYVLSQGAPVPVSSKLPGQEIPLTQVLDVLVAHGWDVNARRHRGSKPFLWQAVVDHDTVVWALDHGAKVQPKDQQPYEDNESLRDPTDCPPLLEQAVQYCCEPSAFDLLRSRGAPMTRRVLHFAAEKAACCVENHVAKRLALVKHLLDKYNLEVNAPDGPSNMGNHWGTPLCYVAHAGVESNCKEITELLLARGADPNHSAEPGQLSAVALAERANNTRFLETIADWRQEATSHG